MIFGGDPLEKGGVALITRESFTTEAEFLQVGEGDAYTHMVKASIQGIDIIGIYNRAPESALKQRIEEVAGTTTPILLGDLNLTLPDVSTLRGMKWAEVPSGPTFRPSSKRAPKSRLDYILIPSGWPRPSEAACIWNQSDHALVLASVRLPTDLVTVSSDQAIRWKGLKQHNVAVTFAEAVDKVLKERTATFPTDNVENADKALRETLDQVRKVASSHLGRMPLKRFAGRTGRVAKLTRQECRTVKRALFSDDSSRAYKTLKEFLPKGPNRTLSKDPAMK